MEESCFKIHYHFYSLQKRLKKQFFGAEYNFFVNIARFARKHFLAYPKLVGTPCRLEKLVYLHFGGGTRRSILSLFVCGQHLMIVVRNSMSAWSISLDSRTLIFRFSRIKANRVVVKCTYKKPKSTLVNIVEQSKEKTKDLLIYI